MKKVFTFLLSFIALSVSAQNRLEAKMDSTSMLIGSQVNLELVVHTKSAAQPTFPTYNEASPIAEGVEVLASSEIEQTEGSSDGEKVWRKKYSLTSFDVGTHQFSPCVLLGNDSLQCSQPLTLKVRALVLDTAQNVQMRGAAGVESVPFAVNYRLLIGGIILGLSIFFTLRLRRRYKQRGSLTKKIEIPAQLAPHNATTAELIGIEKDLNEKAQSSERLLADLADALRRYLAARYGIAAQECTTKQLLAALPIDGSHLHDLATILQTADLAKVAKYVPNANEIAHLLAEAMAFVEQTKDPHISDTPARIDLVPLAEDEVRQAYRKRRRRLWLMVVLTGLCALYVMDELLKVFF